MCLEYSYNVLLVLLIVIQNANNTRRGEWRLFYFRIWLSWIFHGIVYHQTENRRTTHIYRNHDVKILPLVEQIRIINQLFIWQRNTDECTEKQCHSYYRKLPAIRIFFEAWITEWTQNLGHNFYFSPSELRKIKRKKKGLFHCCGLSCGNHGRKNSWEWIVLGGKLKPEDLARRRA